MKYAVLALGITLSMLGVSDVSAHTTKVGALQVIHPWVGAAKKSSSAKAKPTISNTGEEPVTITGADSPAAGEVKMMRDGKLVKTITIKPGETLTPEQVQFELRDLRVTLPEGKGVPITLQTRSDKRLELIFAIGEETMDPQQTISTP